MSDAAEVSVAEPVELAIDGPIARITLNRPDAGNALDLDTARALADHVESLVRRDEVRVIVLGARGRMFCVGGDLGWMRNAGDKVGKAVGKLVGEYHRAILALAQLRAPVIASVAGTAAGGGMSLACACDLVVASEDAKFTVAYTAAGLTPDGGGSWFLPRIVGERKAMELILLNPVLSAADAEGLGLVNRVVAADELDATVDEIATKLANGSVQALGASKWLVRSSFDLDLPQHLGAEGESIAARAGEPDGREGIAAFLEKRTPNFS